ncbi:hypothetical protein [Streptomyces sp. NPDC001774]
MVALRVEKGPEWERVIAALRHAETAIPADVDEGTGDSTEGLAEKAAHEVTTVDIPGHSGKSTGLRARVAAGVEVVGESGRYTVTTSMPEADEAMLPRGLDSGPSGGWRHPVFGRSNVFQRGSQWFIGTIGSGGDDIERRLHNVLESAAEAIGRAGT